MPNYTKNQEENERFALSSNEKKIAKSDLDKPETIMTGEGFICFKPYLDEKKPSMNKGEDPKMYEMAIAIPKTSKVGKQLHGYVTSLLKHHFKGQKKLQMPFKPGDDIVDDAIKSAELMIDDPDKLEEELDKIANTIGALRGHIFFNAKTKFDLNEDPEKPQCIDEKMRLLETSKVNGGDIVRIQICPYIYDVGANKGVAFGLRAVQRLAKGEFSSSGGGNAAGAFTAADTDDDEDDSAGAFAAPVEDAGIEDDVAAAEEETAAEAKAAEEARKEKNRKAREARAKRKAEKEAAEAAEAEEEEDEEPENLADGNLFG